MIEGFVSDSIFDEIKNLHKENKTLDLILGGSSSEQHKGLMSSVKSKNEKRIDELYKQLHKKGVLITDQLTHSSN